MLISVYIIGPYRVNFRRAELVGTFYSPLLFAFFPFSLLLPIVLQFQLIVFQRSCSQQLFMNLQHLFFLLVCIRCNFTLLKLCIWLGELLIVDLTVIHCMFKSSITFLFMMYLDVGCCETVVFCILRLKTNWKMQKQCHYY